MREPTAHRPRLPLWLALAGPPAVWLGHLVLTYGLVYVTCRPGGWVWFALATLVALAAIGAVVAATWPGLGDDTGRALVSGPQGQGGGEVMGRVAWLLAGYFLLVTLMAGVATLMVSPCL